MAHINETHRLRDLDRAFLARYDLQGPRYTSYPTAPEWSDDFGEADWNAHLASLGRGAGADPLSIYLHLPFCRTHCTFCACNVIVSTKGEIVSEPYLDSLKREMDLYAAAVDTSRPVWQLHWGGGTPTYLTPGQLRGIHNALTERFSFAPDAEQSLEIHVNWTSDEHLEVLAELGFNRISMGVQDFNEKTQAAIARYQTYERTCELIELARKIGYDGINCDLVYGLPYQTRESFSQTLDKIIDLRPSRLALYNFAFLPTRLAHQRGIDPETLPEGEEKLQIFLEAHDRFAQAGYRYIGMDHFALPEDELAIAYDENTMQRNFMGFTTRAGGDLLGMGVSSISITEHGFAQNVKKLTQYSKAIDEGKMPIERGMLLSDDDRLRRDVIGSIMCQNLICKRDFEVKYGIKFDEYFANELKRLEPMAEDDLLKIGEDQLELSFLGRLFARNIAMIFDAYLGRAREGKQPQFSKTL